MGLLKWATAAVVLAAALPGTAQAAWLRATSKHFVIYSEGSEARLHAFASKLERFDALLAYASRLKERDENAPKLTVFLLSGQSAVRKSMGTGSRSVAGYYTPRPGGAIAVVPRSIGGSSDFDLDADIILFHEYAHHFMLQYFPSAYPAWYVEGFAEFFSTADAGADGKFSIGKPAKHRFYGLVMTSPMPVELMFKAHTVKMDGAQADNFYGRSWLLTHYLHFDKARTGQFNAYINAINSGVDHDKAAVDTFGPLDQLDRDLKKYQNERKISYLQINSLSTETPDIRIETLSPAEDALVLLNLARIQGIGDDELKDFADDVVRVTTRYPDDPASLDMLANLAMRQEDFERANVVNEAYLKIRPDSSRALLRRAEIAMARLETPDAKPTEADWKAVRSLIAKANRADVHDPMPLVAYYRSFEREGRKPPKLARDGLDRALVLTPQNAELRLKLAHHFIQDEEHELARRILRPLAYSPHDEGGREVAREMLDSIDGGQPAAEVAEAEPAE